MAGKETQQSSRNEGEGNKTAARQYNEAQRRFVQSDVCEEDVEARSDGAVAEALHALEFEDFSETVFGAGKWQRSVTSWALGHVFGSYQDSKVEDSRRMERSRVRRPGFERLQKATTRVVDRLVNTCGQACRRHVVA